MHDCPDRQTLRSSAIHLEFELIALGHVSAIPVSVRYTSHNYDSHIVGPGSDRIILLGY